ncbi:MAG TPA: Qat anti-phage system ATPase QatA [Fimbriimonadaceae bacterium]|nr:Qat anti-phage system ATPase QatA [Fimbriimonadaceae bacterium]
MPSLKTFLSDQETRTDLLSNEGIARTIVALLKERPDRPVTVGVHGDWGVGKSSILEMIEADLVGDQDILCLKFNGWRFQGFEDAKIALLEGIVEGLLEKRPALTKATAAVKEVFRRIDWLKVAKKGGGLAVTALTGLPSVDLIQSAVSTAVSVLRDPAGAGTKAESAIGGLLDLVKPAESSRNVPEEVNEFRKAFDQLLRDAGIKQLIVLVDDLDRCLPDTAIETLEAIRLFVFTSSTAFVIAADEAMIEYAVRRHFPDLPTSSGPQAYARNYLEKLIQVPFRIPALGEAETRVYVALALAQVNLGEDSPEFSALLAHAREVLRRPWLGAQLEDGAVKEALKTRINDAAELLVLSDRIGPILARGTSGNPRQIKRFLNQMLLRERIAESRGFGEDLKLPILAKLLLAERFSPRFFDEVILEASAVPNGFSKSISSLEDASQPIASPNPGGSKEDVSAKKEQSEAAHSPWAQDPWVTSWVGLEPSLANVDLRPYAFVANQQARMSMGTVLGPLIGIVNGLMGPEMSIAGMESQLQKLSQAEAKEILGELFKRVRSSDLKTKPAGIDGIRGLLKVHPSLQPDVIGFLQLLPADGLGPWAISGWGSLLNSEKAAFEAVLTAWSGSTTNTMLATAAGQTLKATGSKK